MDKMTSPGAPAAGNIEGLEEALEQVRLDAHALGRAEGYAAGRADAIAIVGSEHASGRLDVAVELAGDPDVKVERATSLLSKMPKEAASKKASFEKMMEGRAPDVGPSAPEEKSAADLRSARIAELQGIAKHAAPRR